MKDQIPSIIAWYEAALEENPDKVGLNLPLGVLYWVFLRDKKPAQESLNKFLAKYEKSADPDLRLCIERAKETLKKIKKNR